MQVFESLKGKEVITTTSHQLPYPKKLQNSTILSITENIQEKQFRQTNLSACDSPTEKISMYVDSYLQPLAVKIDSYRRHHRFSTQTDGNGTATQRLDSSYYRCCFTLYQYTIERRDTCHKTGS